MHAHHLSRVHALPCPRYTHTSDILQLFQDAAIPTVTDDDAANLTADPLGPTGEVRSGGAVMAQQCLSSQPLA